MDFSTKPKIELHLHLFSTCRPETILDVARKRNLPLPAATADELRSKVLIPLKEGVSLEYFLSKFQIFLPVIAGDPDAIERVAYEWCQTCAEHNVIYSEVRYNPQLVSNSIPNTMAPCRGDLTPRDVVLSVNKGLEAGSKDFGVKMRSILNCSTPHPEWSQEVLALCVEFRDLGVVGIDICAGEYCPLTRPIHEEHVRVFKEAECLGINRTAHAGEAGSYANITQALDVLGAQRIGHGYRGADNEEVYQRLLSSQTHLEACPCSSFATGCFPFDIVQHPISRFAKDGMNFSINTDDPLIIGTTLQDEYRFCRERFGLSDTDIINSIFRAANAAFLPPNEKKEIVQVLEKAYALT